MKQNFLQKSWQLEKKKHFSALTAFLFALATSFLSERWIAALPKKSATEVGVFLGGGGAEDLGVVGLLSPGFSVTGDALGPKRELSASALIPLEEPLCLGLGPFFSDWKLSLSESETTQTDTRKSAFQINVQDKEDVGWRRASPVSETYCTGSFLGRGSTLLLLEDFLDFVVGFSSSSESKKRKRNFIFQAF